ncbi:13793_t:CDS:2 [Funneliformis geosporum]|uniref:4763_t:CDS:1 n=1 Tax=Funneliformis geosporum TaxID=1117311 RepID=A0A9W4T393_9GLOM|nr:13793_t:CDS:2 [Funneliformis geosporum]CAI2190951.1 4763_t:CDS:2 [Funneliformis geosporum]
MVSLAYAEPVEIRRKKKSTHLTVMEWDPEKSNILDVRANNMQDLIYKRGQVSVNKAYITPVASDDKNMKDNSTHMIKKLSHSDQNRKSASKLKEFASNSSVRRDSSFSSSIHMSNTEKKSWLQEVRNLNGNPDSHISKRSHFPIVVGLTAWMQPARAGIGAAISEIIAIPVTRMKVSTTNPQILILGTVDTFAHSFAAILSASQSYNNFSNMSAVPIVTISALLTPDSHTEELLGALTIE